VNALLAQFGEQRVAGFFLVLARVGPLFVFAPLFSSRLMPMRVRGIVAVALALAISPLATGDDSVPTAVMELGGLIVKEILVGMAYAFAVGAIFAAASIAGSYLDIMIGFSFGSVIDPLTGAQASVLAQIYSLVAVLIFIVIGGDGWVVQGLARTYDLVPLTSVPDLGPLVVGVQKAFATMFIAALQLAAPVILALTITDAALGMIARTVPQLNVLAVGFPAKIAVGLLMIAASLPFAAGWLSGQMQQSVSSALELFAP
jgi:flagellar biosynthesis protein FliR